MLKTNTTYSVLRPDGSTHTRRVFRLTPSFVWFREEDGGVMHDRILSQAMFEKWMRSTREV